MKKLDKAVSPAQDNAIESNAPVLLDKQDAPAITVQPVAIAVDNATSSRDMVSFVGVASRNGKTDVKFSNSLDRANNLERDKFTVMLWLQLPNKSSKDDAVTALSKYLDSLDSNFEYLQDCRNAVNYWTTGGQGNVKRATGGAKNESGAVLYTGAGIATDAKGVYAVRFTTNPSRKSVLTRNGFVVHRWFNFSTSLTESDIVEFLLQHSDCQDTLSQDTLKAWQPSATKAGGVTIVKIDA